MDNEILYINGAVGKERDNEILHEIRSRVGSTYTCVTSSHIDGNQGNRASLPRLSRVRHFVRSSKRHGLTSIHARPWTQKLGIWERATRHLPLPERPMMASASWACWRRGREPQVDTGRYPHNAECRTKFMACMLQEVADWVSIILNLFSKEALMDCHSKILSLSSVV